MSGICKINKRREDIQLATKEIIGPEMKQLISYFPNVEEIEVRCPLHIDYLRLLLNAELKTIKKISYEPETPKLNVPVVDSDQLISKREEVHLVLMSGLVSRTLSPRTTSVDLLSIKLLT
ncbi:hypothetical protein BDF21DRAFT_400482 [Thamnidium elegans]|nr:hypothetical protein BDF21DRAFT_400482 [Thamnidium elegans]